MFTPTPNKKQFIHTTVRSLGPVGTPTSHMPERPWTLFVGYGGHSDKVSAAARHIGERRHG
eukprot:308556-Prymnesium_polylepis.1